MADADVGAVHLCGTRPRRLPRCVIWAGSACLIVSPTTLASKAADLVSSWQRYNPRR